MREPSASSQDLQISYSCFFHLQSPISHLPSSLSVPFRLRPINHTEAQHNRLWNVTAVEHQFLCCQLRPPIGGIRLDTVLLRQRPPLRLPSPVPRPPSSVPRPPSPVLRPPPSVFRPPSPVLRPPSSVLRPPPSVFHLPSPVSHLFPPPRPPPLDGLSLWPLNQLSQLADEGGPGSLGRFIAEKRNFEVPLTGVAAATQGGLDADGPVQSAIR